jgi:D-alanyl-lipoteichoic acid acyltransferase DltB (MBOAT superfamily)
MLAASYFFYGFWNWKLLILIVIISATDFIFGSLIHKDERITQRKIYLTISLVINLGILGFFKYCNFFIESFYSLLHIFGSTASFTPLNIILPVGISFYTFQGLSYVLDIYHRKFEPTKDVVAFFAFLSFFPQLIAGPIERARDLLPQFSSPKCFDYDATRKGLFLIAVGLLKKIVIADRLAIYVDSVYANVADVHGFPAVMAAVFFTFQLYLDFSAYSQIAIGTARLFGFKLSTNFNKPYLATSFKDFWARWHITLTNWFRDYLYFPLGGNRKGKIRTYINVIIVFTVSGLWHGASWNFVLWGFLNGIFLSVFDKAFHLNPKNILAKIGSCIFVTSLWGLSLVFFRAGSFSDAITMYGNLGFGNSGDLFNYGFDQIEFKFTLYLLAGLMLIELLLKNRQEKMEEFFFNSFFPLRWIVYLVIILSTIYLGVYGIGSDNTFIYFQF